MEWQFICYPKCGTCGKARNWLTDHEISFTERDIVGERLSRAELQELLHQSGLEIRKFFNTSGKKYKNLGLKEIVQKGNEEELLDYLASDGMLVKRPLLTNGETVLLGFKEAEWEENVR